MEGCVGFHKIICFFLYLLFQPPPIVPIDVCVPGYVCEHGVCNGLSCICDPGWRGSLCHVSECSETCTESEVCSLLNGRFVCVENSNAMKIANFNNSTEKQTVYSTESEIISKFTTVKTVDEKTNSFYNACSPEYQLRAERECPLPFTGVFVCVFGVCNIIKTESELTVQCTCDYGAYGSRCEKKCCKDCSHPHGKCRLDNQNQENCNCVSGYNGPHCETKLNEDPVPDTTTSSATIPMTCTNDSLCENGYCREGHCICNETWGGEFCNETCPFACHNSTICVYRDEQFSCENVNHSLSTTTLHPLNTNEHNVTNYDGLCFGNYTMRPERFCPIVNGFDCVYGACNVTITDIEILINCICDPGSYGGKCEYKCCLDCNEPNGVCRLNETDHEFCDCVNHNYYGTECQQMVPDPFPLDTSWTRWVIGGSAIVVFCLLIAVGITLYFMWRHRVLMVMKIVHKFLPFEDGDDKDFDAFISYRSSIADEKFVYQQLYPKLEKEMGFKLCLHCRDFIPGDTIANNIIRAINNSRRTILVMSKDYIESEFTRFEYQVAQREMLKRKHRIVPIMFGKVPDKSQIDKNLKIILESVTYITWPSDKNQQMLDHFWKQLQLSLPKKRKTSSSLSLSIPGKYIQLEQSEKGTPLATPLEQKEKGSQEDILQIVSTNPEKDKNLFGIEKFANNLFTFLEIEDAEKNVRQKPQIERQNSLVKEQSTPAESHFSLVQEHDALEQEGNSSNDVTIVTGKQNTSQNYLCSTKL